MMKSVIKNSLIVAIAVGLGFGISGCGGASSGLTPAHTEAVAQKKTMTVQRNMWWGPGRWPGMKVAFTTNYKMGPMIPVNSKVTLEAINKNQVSFRYNDNLVILRNMPKHSRTNMAQMMDRYLGTQAVDLSKFTAAEQEKIKQGELAVGMSKEATLIARGYPPVHQTPSLEGNDWKYWKFQAGYTSDTIIVHFKDGKISGFTD